MTSRWAWNLYAAVLAAGLPGGLAAAADPWQTIAPGGATGCAGGEPYTFHAHVADPARLLIFFNGGGACWNALTCDPEGDPTYRTNAGPGSGNDPREYDGAFALSNPENPFRAWSQVFVSYCSGDVHLGAADANYLREDGSTFTIHHGGRANADAALDWVYQRFDKPVHVVVAGGSAGALASPVYAAVVARHYRDAVVTQFGGGGAGYRTPPPAEIWRGWGTIPALPDVLDVAGVTPENLHIIDLYRLAAAAAPRVRFHTYDSAYDAVQESFHALLGYPVELLDGLDANLAELHRDVPHLASYVAGGEFHSVLRYAELYQRESAGVRAVDWVGDVIEPDSDRGDVHCRPDACR